ncbi:NAD(P)H-binding protein [Glycomyces tenuis]|uniref:NmrA family NAD(P)-binding protein n=1 Tax=Glycomyces tenuis TaxID=58116 RepID=UPI00047AF3AA|nr:NAD(P)H-binding protein [Glycomyces tenuis]
MTILITGATGTVGRHLVDRLVSDGHRVRALTRDPAKARFSPEVEVVGGDLTDVTTLSGAFAGAAAAHLITFGGDDGEDLANGDAIVDLAVRSGVRRATVLGGWDRTSVEAALDDSPIGWTLVAAAEFMSGALEWAPEVRAGGTVSTHATYPSAVVHEADIAAVAAVALTEDGHAGKTHCVTGPEALTPAERTRLLGDALGRELAHVQLTVDQERERLRSYGYPEDYVEFGVQLATSPPGVAGEVRDTVESVTKRPARTFAQWAAEHADRFRP